MAAADLAPLTPALLGVAVLADLVLSPGELAAASADAAFKTLIGALG